MKRYFFAGVLLALAGFLVGSIVAGRLPSPATSTIVAAPAAAPTPQARPASLPAAGTLPDLSDVAERAVKASVNISSTSTQTVADPFFQMFYGRDAVRQETSLGSGVIVSTDGYVLTNSHVIGNARASIKVTLPDNRELPATLVGIDATSDLAVVKVDAQNLATIPWGDSSKLRVAEWVLAIGNPFAFSQTVTLGIVSAVNRHDPQLASYTDMIQTDAAINPGNSGGALINARGELVGINTMIYSETGGYQGLGFAIPANLARPLMEELIQHGEVMRGTIGLVTLRNVDPDRAERAGYGRLKGVVIWNMYQNSSAYRAGLQLDDIITRVNDQDVSDAQQVQRIILDAKVGSTIKVDVIRGARRLTFNVPVEKMTAAARR
ncbi:MAG TPA: trypsin-like peptidase domain-containing protein [Vicinamibacterales bacterium]|nr:trypsin-like peptidase domain-containing protein [Vicinamibacterales bacterium]